MERDRSLPTTVEVYVRSLSPEGTAEQQAIFDQLNALSTNGAIDYWSVHVVGKEVCPDTATTTDPGQFICERIQQFKAWAEQEEVSFKSFFERRRVTSKLTGEEYVTMVMPSVTFAEYDEEGSLEFVAPCFEEERHHTPQTRLDELLDRCSDDPELAANRH